MHKRTPAFGQVGAATLAVKVRFLEAARAEGVDVDLEDPTFSQWAMCEALAISLPSSDAEAAEECRQTATELAEALCISSEQLARIRLRVRGQH